MGKEGEIRQKIIEMDLIDAVIGLGPNLFYGTGLAACILVLRQRKKKDRKKNVLILDASREFKRGRAQNELLAEHVGRIKGWYRDYQDVDGHRSGSSSGPDRGKRLQPQHPPLRRGSSRSTHAFRRGSNPETTGECRRFACFREQPSHYPSTGRDLRRGN
jgi:type I restriction-modification system DNA methylase subunit